MTTIAVHAGKFHCDDAMVVALLKKLPLFADATVVRTFDQATINTATVVADIGGEYSHERRRYDHHQRGFAEVFSPKHSKVKLASTGLIWRHYGKEIIQQLTHITSNEDLTLLHDKIYADFLCAIDAHDNGIDQFAHILPPGSEALFPVTTDLSSRVAHLNPGWNESASEEEFDKRFMRAVTLCDSEITECITHTASSWLPARAIVTQAFHSLQQNAPGCDGKVLVMNTFAPWRDHIYSLEEEHSLGPKVLYIVSIDGHRGQWTAVCVPKVRGSFLNRVPFPAAWRGLRDAELSAKTGLDGSVFVHASGFLASHKTLEGILEMCKQSIAISEEPLRTPTLAPPPPGALWEEF